MCLKVAGAIFMTSQHPPINSFITKSKFSAEDHEAFIGLLGSRISDFNDVSTLLNILDNIIATCLARYVPENTENETAEFLDNT